MKTNLRQKIKLFSYCTPGFYCVAICEICSNHSCIFDETELNFVGTNFFLKKLITKILNEHTSICKKIMKPRNNINLPAVFF